MIEIDRIDKFYNSLVAGRHYVYRDFSLKIPTDRNVAILGMNGVGKSTLVRMLSGIEDPDKGKIITNKSVSWPLGIGTGILPSMSGEENTAFICKAYGVQNVNEAHDFVRDFSELGKNYEEMVGCYSSGMKSRLAFAISLLFKFDIMLLDELMSVGDARFKRKCKQVFELWRENGTNMILVSHSKNAIKEHCDYGIILTGEKPLCFNDVNDALKEFGRITKGVNR